MTDPEEQQAHTAKTDFSRQRSRLFWGAAIVTMLAILLVCVALIAIAAMRH
jgi:uncharacterized membrane protein